jgi:predicted dehydrogenase
MTSSTERFKVAVVGLGRMGSGYDSVVPSELPRSHVAAILANPALVLEAVCDFRAEARVAFISERKLHVPVFESLEQIFAHAQYDIVVVATDAASHEQVVQACFEAQPRIVFCEKPFCSDTKTAEKLDQELGRRGIQVAVNYHRRWDERFIRLRNVIQEYGPVRYAEVLYVKGLRNYGAHAIDLLQFLFGSIKTVYGLPCSRVESVGLSDPSYCAFLGFDNGLQVNMIGLDNIEYELFDLEIVTSMARFSVEFGGHSIAVRHFENDLHFKGYTTLSAAQSLCKTGPVHGLTAAYDEFVQSLRCGEPICISLANNAVNVHRVMDAIASVACGGDRIVL